MGGSGSGSEGLAASSMTEQETFHGSRGSGTVLQFPTTSSALRQHSLRLVRPDQGAPDRRACRRCWSGHGRAPYGDGSRVDMPRRPYRSLAVGDPPRAGDSTAGGTKRLAAASTACEVRRAATRSPSMAARQIHAK
jgi:hypothetical protein